MSISTSPSCFVQLADPAEHIKVSSFYEIDRSKLPHKCPDQLKSARVAMVNEKTRMRVSLRYPSVHSLKAYFDERNRAKSDVKKLPALDEKCIIGSEVAAEALYRRIPPHEITEKRNSWRFWAVSPTAPLMKVSSPSSSSSPETIVFSKEGFLSPELKGAGMVKWGKRRQVKFLSGHVEDKPQLNQMIVPFNVKVGEEEESTEVEEEEVDEEDAGEEEDSKAEKPNGDDKNRKRKSHETSCRTQMKKRPKREMRNQIVVCRQRKKKKMLKNCINRWSAERYKLAEINMLKIMKEQGAVFGKPVLRPELRAQARKLIGDTGLLDHLLKHMSGKLAPGGEERFRRRHNSDGAMEYWLEKANLMDIRREAGVQDPYWTPPPGWKPGDNPSRDPVCAKEIKELKEEMDKIRKDIEELVSKKCEQAQAIESTPISAVTTQNMEPDCLLIPLKERYIDLVNRKSRLEGQLLDIAESLCGMEKEIEELKTQVEESKRTESAEIPALFMGSLESTSKESRIKEAATLKKKAVISWESEQEHCEAGARGNTSAITKSPALTENKAAKIQRLKSGFRICKPQGTFLWPNMSVSPTQVVVQLEDLLAISTPPSASSTSATQSDLLPAPPSQYHEPHPTSPVKPLAEKRPVTITVSTAVTRLIPSPSGITPTQFANFITATSVASTSVKASVINLNEPPNDQNEYSSQVQSSSYPVTYQRRFHNLTSATADPCLSTEKKEVAEFDEEMEGQ